MNNIQQAIHEHVVQPALQARWHPLVATITSYDNNTNTTSVRFRNPMGIGYMTLDLVPVTLGSGGVHSAGPFVGDEVWVHFEAGNAQAPKVVSLADSNYYNNTRLRFKQTRQGVNIPDSMSGGINW